MTVPKYYALRTLLDHLLLKSIRPHNPRAYHYENRKWKMALEELTPVENLHIWGVKQHMKDIIVGLDGQPLTHLSERQQKLRIEQRDLLLKRAQSIEFVDPMLLGDALMKLSMEGGEESWL